MRTRVFGAFLAQIAVMLGVSFAQPPYYDSCIFYGECIGDSVVRVLEGYDVGGDPTHVGYDIYRSTVADCGDPVRVTDQPLARQTDTWYVIRFVDRNVANGTQYEYEIVYVDEHRNILEAICGMPGSFQTSWVACGTAPATHGTIVDFDWTVYIEPCEGTCYPGAIVEYGDEELRPYIGSQVRLFGSVGFADGVFVSFDRFELAPCTVPVESFTWGNIKSLYR